MESLRTLFATFLLYSVCCLSVWAQDIVPEEMTRPEKELPTVRLQPILFFNHELPEMYYLDGYNQFKKLSVSKNRPGAQQKVQLDGGGFSLYRKQVIEGVTKMSRIITFPYSSKAGSAYLFFYADENGGLKYQVVEDSAGKHPAQTVRFINLTDNDIIALVNDKTYSLSPGDDKTSPEVGENNFRFRLSYAMNEGGKFLQYTPVKLYKFITPNSRALMVVSYQMDEKENDGSGRREKYWRPYMMSAITRVPENSN
ncbi:hypothetical protein [Cerasicoccus fimbriatus]|uniref:hypothetical protein n=1 Tax=Cerasicoccus fimbriatus TaxID=3014554 RepID=UPI0022B48860|nr:hypothetical protein [Cerasicoccus sp. TK19100]